MQTSRVDLAKPRTETTGGDARFSAFADRHFAPFAIGPSILVFVLLMGFPLIYSLYISFFAWRLTNPDVQTFIGIENYLKLLTSPLASRYSLWVPLRNTLTYTASSVGLEFVLGFAIALLFQRQGKKLSFLRTFVIVPMMLSEIVIALMWRLMWDASSGMVNFLVESVGLPPQAWLGDRSLALFTLVLTDVWQNTPFVFLMLLAGLQALPEDVYESATIDGASALQRFVHITVPLMRPVIVVAVLFRFIFNFRDFAKIYTLTGGGPGRSTEVLSVTLYQHMFRNFDAGFGSAMAWVIVLLTAVIAAIFLRPLWRHITGR